LYSVEPLIADFFGTTRVTIAIDSKAFTDGLHQHTLTDTRDLMDEALARALLLSMSPMTPARWGELEELYQAALALPASERTALLERADPELRATVKSILAQEGGFAQEGEKGDAPPVDGAFLDRPAWEGRESLLKHDGPLREETPVSVGEQLGPYRIEQKIGEGGMGSVYRATDTRLHRPVAIKISRNLFDERFEREARTISSLNHPHICTLHDIGPDYMVMELVEGETLAARIRKGALPVGDVLRYGAQIAGALAAAHDKNTRHRDLKPSNVMITKNGVKVLDFGLAKCSTHEGTLTWTGAVMGTPAYMAPEQLEGKEADARTDIFALGHTLYEMATAKRVVPGQRPAMERPPGKIYSCRRTMPGTGTGEPLAVGSRCESRTGVGCGQRASQECRGIGAAAEAHPVADVYRCGRPGHRSPRRRNSLDGPSGSARRTSIGSERFAPPASRDQLPFRRLARADSRCLQTGPCWLSSDARKGKLSCGCARWTVVPDRFDTERPTGRRAQGGVEATPMTSLCRQL
jgi:hypothetical protein